MTQQNHQRVLFISFLIITLFMVIEAVGGVLTNSLALLSDAGHMLSDAISLAIALLALTFSVRLANKQQTFGYKRFEILAAALNGLTLIAIALYIFYEAIGRLANPPAVATTGMLIISTIGLLVNIFVAWFLMKNSDPEENLNMRGAYLHVLSDLLGSAGAIIAALLMLFFGWGIADPIASVIVAALVLRSGFKITADALHVLMEGTPKNVDIEKITTIFTQQPEIKAIHDLHIWTITSGLNALSCHAVVDEQLSINETTQLLKHLEHELAHANIQHVTIQLESHQHDAAIFCTARAEVDPHAHHNH